MEQNYWDEILNQVKEEKCFWENLIWAVSEIANLWFDKVIKAIEILLNESEDFLKYLDKTW